MSSRLLAACLLAGTLLGSGAVRAPMSWAQSPPSASAAHGDRLPTVDPIPPMHRWVRYVAEMEMPSGGQTASTWLDDEMLIASVPDGHVCLLRVADSSSEALVAVSRLAGGWIAEFLEAGPVMFPMSTGTSRPAGIEPSEEPVPRSLVQRWRRQLRDGSCTDLLDPRRDPTRSCRFERPGVLMRASRSLSTDLSTPPLVQCTARSADDVSCVRARIGAPTASHESTAVRVQHAPRATWLAPSRRFGRGWRRIEVNRFRTLGLVAELGSVSRDRPADDDSRRDASTSLLSAPGSGETPSSPAHSDLEFQVLSVSLADKEWTCLRAPGMTVSCEGLTRGWRDRGFERRSLIQPALVFWTVTVADGRPEARVWSVELSVVGWRTEVYFRGTAVVCWRP